MNSQNITDKHADQKWSSWKQYHEADPRKKSQLQLAQSASNERYVIGSYIKYAVSCYCVISVEFVILTKALFTLMHK